MLAACADVLKRVVTGGDRVRLQNVLVVVVVVCNDVRIDNPWLVHDGRKPWTTTTLKAPLATNKISFKYR